MPNKPILCLDFDGVIHSYTSGWQGIDNIPDPPVDGAFEFLYEAIKYFQVVIYSSRCREQAGREAIATWLAKYDKEWRDGRGEFGPLMLSHHIKIANKKPAAFATLDDRALTFNGKFPDAKELLNFRPWWWKE